MVYFFSIEKSDYLQPKTNLLINLTINLNQSLSIPKMTRSTRKNQRSPKQSKENELAEWVYEQKRDYIIGNLEKEKKDLLEMLPGFSWDFKSFEYEWIKRDLLAGKIPLEYVDRFSQYEK